MNMSLYSAAGHQDAACGMPGMLQTTRGTGGGLGGGGGGLRPSPFGVKAVWVGGGVKLGCSRPTLVKTWFRPSSCTSPSLLLRQLLL